MSRVVRVAQGLEPADLVLANARVVNTFTAEVEEADVAICEGRVAGLGRYLGRERIDLRGRYLAPGFIQGHVHLESSHLHPTQYARAVVPRGTTTVVTDLHEIANVAGLPGVRYILNQARRLPLELRVMVPSCVPATPAEQSGARLGVREVARALRWQGVVGLGEVMDFPGVLSGGEALEKVALARGKVIDGHAPGLSGPTLNAYIAAGIGSDHETVSAAEGREKLRRGMYLMIREGSSEKNLEALLPLVNDNTFHRCLFVADDRSPHDLLHEGEMDAIVRKAISLGLPPIRALQMATINPATYFRLYELGAVAPGYRADLMVLSDLTSAKVEMVFSRGRLVAREGQALFPTPRPGPTPFARTVNMKPLSLESLRLPASRAHLPAIKVVPGQIVTRRCTEAPTVKGGQIVADPQHDLLKLVVAERYRASGEVGVALVRGFGLHRGALASSIAHDSHHIVAVGVSDADILTAVAEVARHQGGLVAAADGKVVAALPLPLFGLLSPEPLEVVARGMEAVEAAARGLGCRLPAPLAALSFLALPVIPELRLTPRGLVDGATGQLLT